MSRLAAYLGPPAPASSIIERGTFPLLRQAALNADGFGIGWYPDDGKPEPLRLLSRLPMWSEPQIVEVARRSLTHCAVAGARKAIAGTAPELSGTQPFQSGTFLFHHDGELGRFREVFERPLRARLGDRAHQSISGSTDAELLFATWLDALGERTGGDAIADALERTVETVRQLAGPKGAAASFATVVTDGQSLVALRTSTNAAPPSLYTIVAEEGAPVPRGARVVASEPLFPGTWTTLEPHSLVIFTS